MMFHSVLLGGPNPQGGSISANGFGPGGPYPLADSRTGFGYFSPNLEKIKVIGMF